MRCTASMSASTISAGFAASVFAAKTSPIALLADDAFLSQLYSVPLFEHDLIRTLRLIPTEYLFFYYSRRRALENQRKQGSSRGAEVEELNRKLIPSLAQLLRNGDPAAAIATYAAYLNTRSSAYMKLEGEGGSASARRRRQARKIPSARPADITASPWTS